MRPRFFGDPGAHPFFADDEAFVLQFVRRLPDGVPGDAEAIGEFYFFWEEDAFAKLLHGDEFAEVVFHLDVEGQFAFMVNQFFSC